MKVVLLARYRAEPTRPGCRPCSSSRSTQAGQDSSRIVATVEARLVEGMGRAAPAKPLPPFRPSCWRGSLMYVLQPKTECGREWAGRFALTPDPLLEMNRQMGERVGKGVNGRNGHGQLAWTQSRTKQRTPACTKCALRRPYDERLADGRPTFGTFVWDSVRQRPCPPYSIRRRALARPIGLQDAYEPLCKEDTVEDGGKHAMRHDTTRGGPSWGVAMA